MSDEKVRDVLSRWERRKGDRAPIERDWQQQSEYMLPGRADYTVQRSPGTNRMAKLFDSTALWALQQASAGLHGYMASPTEPWFVLKPEDETLENDAAVVVWLAAAAKAMYSRFSSPSLNFATQSHELFNDQLSIGTAAMAILERPGGGIMFSTRHMSECVIEENDEDVVDGLNRRWEWTAKQAWQRWGSAAGEKVMKALADDKPDQMFAFHHQVRPRSIGARDHQRNDAKHKRFASVYVSEADKSLIAEGGFDEFPYLCPRFNKSGSTVYGDCPATWALPDVKMANQMQMTVIIGAQQAVDPPMQYPEDTFTLPLRTTPGARNPYRAGARDRAEPITMGGDPRFGVEQLTRVQAGIMRGFYLDWMTTPSDLMDPASAGKGVTATFTINKRDQAMRLLSPLLARQRSEFLGRLISRTFAILWRQSVALKFGPGSPFPPPPPTLSGMPWKVEYISPAELAQRGSTLDTVSRLTQSAVLLSQIDPSVRNIVNAEQAMRETARALNANPLMLRSREEVAAREQAEAQAQQLTLAAQAASGLAGAAKDGTAAMKNAADAQQMQVAA